MVAFIVSTQAEARSQILGDSTGQSRERIDGPQSASSSVTTGLKLISAPVPTQQETIPLGWKEIPFHFLDVAPNGEQTSSQVATQTSAASSNSRMSPVFKAKPTQRALGLALAIAGTTALATGVTLYVGEQHAYCNNSSKGCNEAKDTGIALMPTGASVAAIGFYLRFHR